MKPSTRMRVASIALLLLMTGCAQDDESVQASSVGAVDANGISADRCQANRDAGELTYLTSFDYAATPSILDVVVASELGYFEKMCLNVKLQPGFTNDNIPIVSSGRVAFSSLGSLSEVAVAQSKGAEIEAIAAYGHKAVEALAVSNKAGIESLPQLHGTTMGVLGSIPYSIQLMLVRAGVSLDSIRQMAVPFDPTLLDRGDFASRPVYKSNEPRQLDRASIGYKLFDPAAENIPASFGVMIVNRDFADQHPTAVEDFLRADLAGFRYALDHPQESVDMAFARTNPANFLTEEGERHRWSVESTLVRDSTPAGRPFGFLDEDLLGREVEPLAGEVKAVPDDFDALRVVDSRYFDAIHDGGELVWPNN